MLAVVRAQRNISHYRAAVESVKLLATQVFPTDTAMSALHLAAGSVEPPRVEGKVRLYGMKFCPFTHRVRLTLSYKKIPHDTVNINLKNKPEWYLKIEPDGKVPALMGLDGNVITDSGKIVNYLDKEFPEPSLFIKSLTDRDSELIGEIDKIVKIFSNCIHKRETRPLQEAVDEICEYLTMLNEELGKRNKSFFMGDKPGYIDIYMWPFVERAKSLPIICDSAVYFNKEKFPHIMKWISEMKNEEFVKENAITHEQFAKVVAASDAGTIDYDNI